MRGERDINGMDINPPDPEPKKGSSWYWSYHYDSSADTLLVRASAVRGKGMSTRMTATSAVKWARRALTCVPGAVLLYDQPGSVVGTPV